MVFEDYDAMTEEGVEEKQERNQQINKQEQFSFRYTSGNKL